MSEKGWREIIDPDISKLLKELDEHTADEYIKRIGADSSVNEFLRDNGLEDILRTP